jgi:hypothetical protein
MLARPAADQPATRSLLALAQDPTLPGDKINSGSAATECGRTIVDKAGLK